MLCRRTAFGFLILLACESPVPQRTGDSESIASFLPTLPALGTLEDVRLGMSTGDLLEVRPAARPAPYNGYREVADGDTLLYRPSSAVAMNMDDGGPVRIDKSAPILAVELQKTAASTASADTLWQSYRLEISRLGPTRCFEFMRGDSAIGATVVVGQTTVGVIRYPQRQRRDINGPHVDPARVIAFAAKDLTLLVPAGIQTRDIACPLR